MLDQLIAPDIKALIEEGKFEELITFFVDRHPTETAEILSGLSEEETQSILDKLDPQSAADIFCELPNSYQVELASSLDQKALAALVVRLSPDDRVDLLKALPEEQFEEVLPALAKREREDIKKLAAYKEGTAGSKMTTDYIALSAELSVRQALERIRLEGSAKESIHTIFVVDENRRLQGSVELVDLILSNPNHLLRDLMDDQAVSVSAEVDQEEAVYNISRYDLVALPVVDSHGALVGIITHDDAIDVIEEERTEDMERFMAISGKHGDEGYLRTSIWSHFIHRVPWLVVLSIMGLVSGAILQSFEATLTKLMLLTFYMPMLAGTGGNTGSQSATMVIRALALKEIEPRDAFKIVWKECRVAFLLGIVLGLLALGRVLITSPDASLPGTLSLLDIGFAIGLALAIQVLSATIIGALLPLSAAALGMDPALVASPALSTVVDITGLLIYFGTARVLLGI